MEGCYPELRRLRDRLALKESARDVARRVASAWTHQGWSTDILIDELQRAVARKGRRAA
jgi:hypothetical protein